MANWINIDAAANIGEGEHICTQVADKPLVILHVAGKFYAISNICPHAGLPLGEGDLAGHVLTCPFHGYAYHIKNGRNLDFPDMEPPVRTYPVRVEQEKVQVDIDPD